MIRSTHPTDYDGFQGLDKRRKELLRYARAMFCQGLASTIAMGRFAMRGDRVDMERYIEVTSEAMLRGFKDIFAESGEKDVILADGLQPRSPRGREIRRRHDLHRLFQGCHAVILRLPDWGKMGATTASMRGSPWKAWKRSLMLRIQECLMRCLNHGNALKNFPAGITRTFPSRMSSPSSKVSW